MSTITLECLAKMIDHSLLHPTMTDEMVHDGCLLAMRYQVATVCVKPYQNALAAEILGSGGVQVCSVTGFPHGNSTIDIKIAETEAALRDGAREIDMVVNIGKVKSGDWNYVEQEILAVQSVVANVRCQLKVIFENDYLESTEIIRLCEISTAAGVAFVKTSTGYGFVKGNDGRYGYNGATHQHLKLMRAHAAPEVQIKAAGGVRTLDDLLAVRELGVTRIGATATEMILETAKQRGIA